MSIRSGLIPTVITNKNGVMTTVYRKPQSAAPSALPLVPVAQASAVPLDVLAHDLTAKAERTYSDDEFLIGESRCLIEQAVKSRERRPLELFERHFRAGPVAVNLALSVFRDANITLDNHELFAQAVTFIGFTEGQAREGADTLLPLIHKHPDRLEELAHCYNVLRRIGTPDRASVSKMLNKPHDGEQQLAPSIHHLGRSNTPVQDIRAIATNGTPYHRTDHLSRQTVALLANAVRNGTEPRMLRREIVNSSDTIFDVAVFLNMNADLLSPQMMGRNGLHLSDAVASMRRVSGVKVLENLDLSTEESLAQHNALVLYLLSIDNFQAGLLIFRQSGRSARDEDWLNLLRRRNKPEETAALAKFYNQRGTHDAKAAETYLDSQLSAPVKEGWL